MKRIGKILRVILKAIGIPAIVWLVVLLSIIGILNILFRGDNDPNAYGPQNDYATHSFQVNQEDRLVKGMYIPSRKSAFAFTVSVAGEALQDCQLIVSTSNGRSTQFEQYSKPSRFLISKGKIDNKEIRLDSYNEENISVVIRASENDKRPIGNLKVTVR